MLQSFLLGGLKNDIKKPEESQHHQASSSSIDGFASGGPLHQYFSSQQNEQKKSSFPTAQALNKSPENPDRLCFDRQQNALEDFPVGGLLHSYFLHQQSEKQLNSLGSFGNYSGQFSSNQLISPAVSGLFQRQSTMAAESKNEAWPDAATKQPDSYAENGMLGPWSAASAALLGEMALADHQGKSKKNKKSKPKDRPKRPLSAYNIFFKEERARILERIPDAALLAGPDRKLEDKKDGNKMNSQQRKVGFQELAKMIGKRWKNLEDDELNIYKKKAETDMGRYKEEMLKYVANEKKAEEC